MPKKGKGRKGKEKTDSSQRDVQPKTPDQPGSSSSQAGKGHKEKEKSYVSQSTAQPITPDQPSSSGSSSVQIGKGYGRGKGAAAQSSVTESPGIPAQHKGPSEQTFFERDTQKTMEVKHERQAPKGRGRGRGVPAQTSVTPSPGIYHRQEDSGDMKADFPELPADATKVTAPSKNISTKKSVLSKEEQDNLLLQMAGISMKQTPPAVQKMPFATRPRNLPLINDKNRISLYVNYFRLTYKDAIVYHYDIDIAESTKDKKIGQSLMSQGRTEKEDIKKNVKHVEREKRRNLGKGKCRKIIAETFKNTASLQQYCPVYDGQKNLFTSKPLPCKNEPFKVDLEIEGRPKSYFVTIAPVKKEDKTNIISLEPLKNLYARKSNEIPYEVLLVYETVMSHREPGVEPQQVHFRNSFFDLRSRKDPLGCGLEVWFGYHQSVQLTELCPVVVINLAAKAFHKAGSVIEYANDVLDCDITRLTKFQHWQISNLTDALKGLQIKVTHQRQPRKYKIKAVVEKSARDITFDCKGRKITIVQYYLNEYQTKLAHPHLPCLQMQTSNNTTFIPMELCKIVEGQPKIGKLNAELTSKMIRGTAVAPENRKNTISKTSSKVNDISGRYMHAFGLLMDIKLLKVDGRIITAPQLSYDEKRTARPDPKGVWRIEDGKKFYTVVKLERWVLISFADERRCGRDSLSRYCEFLVKSARKCGMQLDRPLSIDIYGRNVSTEEALIAAKKCNAQFAIVVLNRRDNYHSYDEVKFLADFKYNLVTQCMEDKTLSRINDQITTNVCLKINVKLGGINHILFQRPQIFCEPVIVLGVDAIHWSRGYGYPSIVSVVGTLNPTASRYSLVCDLQRNEKHEKISQEIIRNMEYYATEILSSFKHTNSIWPKKIVVFRDGVSEGQFQHALDYEVSGIQKACMNIIGHYLPITFLVVQKRHNTRFFPVNPSQGVGRNQNVPPGTCVDRDITHPVFFDYFICSHEGIQGTSKPAHYTVLHNDMDLGAEELQQLCYFLCHTYVRCTRSVSLPAPVMYADLAAARAKKYADLFINPENMSVSSDTQKDLPPDVERAIKSMKSFTNNMFYV